MRDLSSKLVAGGLSAGAILLWWPVLFETEGLVSWTIRGVIWTLTFELLLLALLPLERAFWNDTRPGRTVANRAAGAKSRVLNQQSQGRRVASLALVAAFVLAIPVSLIVNGPPVSGGSAKPRQVVEITKVVRVVERGQTKVVYVPRAARHYAAAELTQPRAPKALRQTDRKVVRSPQKSPSTTDGDEPVVTEEPAPATEPLTETTAAETQ